MELKHAIKDWSDDPQWEYTLLRDRELDEDLESVIREVVDELQDAEMSSARVDEFLNDIRLKSQQSIESADAKKDAIARWRSARIAYVYYGLGEAIIEGSKFSNSVLDRLKDELGDSYLEYLQTIDKLSPSSLTDIKMSTDAVSQEADDLLSSDAVRLYLTLKNWQDDQHIYHEEYLHPKFRTYRSEFKEYIESNYPHLSNESERDVLFILDNIYNRKPLTLRSLADSVKREVIDIGALSSSIGGKATGLVKLLEVDANTPETFVVPVESGAIADYLPSENDEWAVRSSANVEDGEDNAFAGIFESYLRVSNEDLQTYVNKVIQSSQSKRAIDYVRQFKTSHPEMAVLVQKFSEPDIAGVWLGSDSSGGQLEWVEGDGEKLVSGKVTPTHEDWENLNIVNNDGSLESIDIEDKPIGLEAIELQEKLEVAAADFEFCIVNGDILWLQYRPVTRMLAQSQIESHEEKDESSIYGRPASPGVCKAAGFVADEPQEASEFNDGQVLICESTDPDWLELMIKSGGILTSEGGALCHAAITARELGKPAVVGAGNAVLELHGRHLRVNGGTGRIELL